VKEYSKWLVMFFRFLPHKGDIMKEDERKCEWYVVVVCLADIILLFSSNIFTLTARNNVTLYTGTFYLRN